MLHTTYLCFGSRETNDHYGNDSIPPLCKKKKIIVVYFMRLSFIIALFCNTTHTGSYKCIRQQHFMSYERVS